MSGLKSPPKVKSMIPPTRSLAVTRVVHHPARRLPVAMAEYRSVGAASISTTCRMVFTSGPPLLIGGDDIPVLGELAGSDPEQVEEHGRLAGEDARALGEHELALGDDAV